MERLEYSVLTRADRALVWKIFSDWRQWHNFCDVYGEMQWLKGAPWEPGSRLRIEVVRPVRTIVNHVITVCVPPGFVAWIDHALSNTMEQWVTFHELADGGTRIHTWLEIAGSAAAVEGCNLHEFLKDFITKWYDALARTCDRLALQKADAGFEASSPGASAIL